MPQRNGEAFFPQGGEPTEQHWRDRSAWAKIDIQPYARYSFQRVMSGFGLLARRERS